MMASKAGEGDSDLTELLRRELDTSKLQLMRSAEGGCISQGGTYLTDAGKVFIKVNSGPHARTMFEGEAASLESLAAVGVVRVPKPVKVISIPGGGAAIVMENLDIVGSLRSKAATLGEQMARLHLHNAQLTEREDASARSVHKGTAPPAVKSFGFHVATCCGYIPQNNDWTSTWEELFARKIDQQVMLLQEKCGDREVVQQWSSLQVKWPLFFTGLTILPSLLHADLWTGNAAELDHTPVVFDPASFYGHSEFDLSLADTFMEDPTDPIDPNSSDGHLPKSFFDSYFKVIPKTDGYSTRLQLYKLFHYLNHWNHFGGDYKHCSSSALNMFRMLNKLQL